jgi:YidC/Oxa1 family membrane protein insertase
MNNENTRNTIIFVVSAAVILIAYQMFVLGPAAQKRQAEAARTAPAAATVGERGAPIAGPAAYVARDQALARSARVKIDNPAVSGSVALTGGRIDDLYLKDYRQALAKTSPPVELFRPEGAEKAHFAEFGWTGLPNGPTPSSVWRVASGDALAPGKPVTLAWDNGQGLSIARTIAVDDRYLFTVTDTVVNRGPGPVQLAPYASVQRQGLPQLSNNPIIHEGGVGSLGDRLKLVKFKAMKEKGPTSEASTGGWLGVTDKYWLAAVIPNANEAVKGEFRVSNVNGVDVYEADYVGPARTLEPGRQTTETMRMFAGAKKVSVLQDYEKSQGLARFDDAVDWGNLWFLTRPMFMGLEFFHSLIGNFGLSILCMTVLLRLIMFPLANKSYESVSKMKKLQPQMEEIKKRHPNDPAKMQQETMELYRKEKINPLAGCLPVLVQIPVFYALYKVLFVTLEMRHAPFFGWIHDLSAPDGTTWLNLFGLIPWDPAMTPMIGSFLGGPLQIGVWPILYGITMWLTTSMSPAPSQDPAQKIIFQLFPIIFTFTLAHMPAGLVIYWTWSNILSILQQYVIMRRLKVDNPIDDIIGRFTGRPRHRTG